MLDALLMPYFHYCSPAWSKSPDDYHINFNNSTVGPLELSPFLTMRFDQLSNWMSSAGKRLNTLRIKRLAAVFE